MAKVIAIVISGFLLILAMIFIKYKPVYEVTIAGEKLGYIERIDEFKNLIEEKIINQEGEYIADVSLIQEPEYNFKLLKRTSEINSNDVIEELKTADTVITYKYYEVALNNETKSYVKTLEEAEKVVNEIKEEFADDNLEVATASVENAAKEIKEENENKDALAIVNNIKLSVLPVTGRITSRYGERSSLRRSTHTGLDIACTTGTDIKVVSNGTVTFSGKKGSYGNLIIVDHGNGVETWYGHCSKLYAKVGDTVNAGDVIAAVGSTGNSTGPHLHFEIRIDGECVNPQNYVY